MKINLTMLAKSFAVVVATIAVLTLGHGEARADEVTISGSTEGSTSVPNLIFNGNSFFTGTTALGIGSLSEDNDLGSFFLISGPLQLVSGSFTLNVTFTNPLGINGGQGATYLASFSGSISPNIDQGGVTIAFETPSQTFNFNDGTNFGSFTLTLPATLFVQNQRSAEFTAGFTGQQSTAIPEPATLLLLGTGLTGIAAKLRQKKRARAEKS